ncbi:MAG: hypothetical protein ACXWCZ_04695 [Flavisolibacter sp.]
MQKTSIAQTEHDPKAYRTEKAIILYAGGGLSYFIGKAGTPNGFDADVKKTNPIGSLRLMWHPGHLLHAGLETGWLRFYSYSIDNNGKKGTTEINATPILLVFSMPVSSRFHVFAGTGIYLMTSILDYETKVKSKGYNLGWMVATSYHQSISEKFGLAYELKWMNASGTNDRVLSAQVQLMWKLK